MQIAQIAPLCVGVSPSHYDSTERIICSLTEELIRQGHQVTLFSYKDFMPQARLMTACPRALHIVNRCREPLMSAIILLEEVLRQARAFDFLHFHADYLHLPLVVRQKTPHVTTLHGWLDIPDVASVYQTFPAVPVVSISDTQRTPLPWLRWQGTVHYGIPKELYTFQDTPGTYLAFFGHISPAKGVDQAIAIAQQVGMPLKIGGRVDWADQEYFQQCIRPLLDNPLVEYLGEMDELDKNTFLGQAYALLFPTEWPEPFDLVMIEALACGTPMIAYRRGAVPEILEDGVTGWIVEGCEEAVQAVPRVAMLSRAHCRQVFEERFTVSRMVQDYLCIYQRLVARTVVSLRAMG
jgi:glycosyltransferase involved in cell wall biosynthesis